MASTNGHDLDVFDMSFLSASAPPSAPQPEAADSESPDAVAPEGAPPVIVETPSPDNG